MTLAWGTSRTRRATSQEAERHPGVRADDRLQHDVLGLIVLIPLAGLGDQDVGARLGRSSGGSRWTAALLALRAAFGLRFLPRR